MATMESPVYQGEFGTYTITAHDRREVQIYRAGLAIAALCFAGGVGLVCGPFAPETVLPWLTPLYTGFTLALGISLLTIHIYMAALHRALQAFWLVGTVAAIAIGHGSTAPFALTVYQNPLTILGLGFTFAALTGIYFKEAFCFNRLETKLLTPLVPLVLLGHLSGWLSPSVGQTLLSLWAGLFLVFAARKLGQDIPSDIGDKSVFMYLRAQRHPSPNPPSSSPLR